jgi:hypothetical protein
MFYGPKWAAPPLFRENLHKINKQKCYKTTKYLQKIFVSENQFFLTIRTTYNMLKESYSIAKHVPKVLEEIKR